MGDHVDTDLIIPARFLNQSDEKVLAMHCLADARPEFAREVRPGDWIVAGRNFGCGSSREHAALALRGAGISGVIAKSFARIFYRNALNIGLPVLESEEAPDHIEDGERIFVDLETGEICRVGAQELFSSKPLPPFMREILRAGGLVPYVKEKGQRNMDKG
jgi:3-isopropylmalate/(R)-2-methylmalate dehydratase small subunit